MTALASRAAASAPWHQMPTTLGLEALAKMSVRLVLVVPQVAARFPEA